MLDALFTKGPFVPQFFSNEKLLTIAAGTVFHFGLFIVLWPVCRHLWPQYFNINTKKEGQKSVHEEVGSERIGLHSKKEQVEWVARMVSTVHASWTFVVGMYIFFTRTFYYRDHDLMASDRASALLYCFSNGYFISDLMLELLYGRDLGAIAHHIIIGGAQQFILAYDKMYIMGISSCVTEFTTPFVNLRWFFAKAGVKDWRFLANGLIMFIGFGLIRVTYSPFYLAFFSYINWETISSMPYAVMFWYAFTTIGLSYLNVTWFIKITKGVVKALGGNKHKHRKHHGAHGSPAANDNGAPSAQPGAVAAASASSPKSSAKRTKKDN